MPVLTTCSDSRSRPATSAGSGACAPLASSPGCPGWFVSVTGPSPCLLGPCLMEPCPCCAVSSAAAPAGTRAAVPGTAAFRLGTSGSRRSLACSSSVIWFSRFTPSFMFWILSCSLRMASSSISGRGGQPGR